MSRSKKKKLYRTKRLIKWFVSNIEDNLIIYAQEGISTSDLVDLIFNFCELYSGRTMYKYQGQFSKRIIRSVLENDGEELTALFARQMGKIKFLLKKYIQGYPLVV